MKVVKITGLVTVLVCLTTLAFFAAPSVFGQSRRAEPRPNLEPFRLFGGGSQIGASVRDLEGSEATGAGGVYVESVRPDSAADKASIKRADIITRWDGEAVRSARQFSRLVQETGAGRTVKATLMREGRSTDVSVTTSEGERAGDYIDSDRLAGDITSQLQERFGDLRGRLNRVPFDFNFDFDLPGVAGGARLGVTVEELTPQLATYFGAKDGVLVATVADDSPASRAGLKAGDVIASVNGQNVASRGDLLRALRSVRAQDEVTIGIVRDKKESSVKTKLDEARARRPVRSIRPVRSTPA